MLDSNWLIKKLDIIDSTQDYAKTLDIYGKQIAVIARHQTKGYGQYGRQWIGFQDNLFVSLIIPAEKISSDITLITSIAIGNILLNHGVNIEYKWVNDILINGKKIAGILTEYLKGNLIIGIGVNIKQNPSNVEHFTSTNLLENGMNISNDTFLDLILKSFTETYNKWLQNGFRSFKDIWKSHAYKLNERVTITDGNLIINGNFTDIDDYGRIIIENEDGFHIIQRGSLR